MILSQQRSELPITPEFPKHGRCANIQEKILGGTQTEPLTTLCHVMSFLHNYFSSDYIKEIALMWGMFFPTLTLRMCAIQYSSHKPHVAIYT